MTSLQRFPIPDWHDRSNTGYVPVDRPVHRMVPGQVSVINEGADVTWQFPAFADAISITNPALCATLTITQPVGTTPESMVPLVEGSARGGLYDLFSNWRILIGGITVYTPSQQEIYNWIEQQAAYMSSPQWEEFQAAVRCRYTHPSSLISGAGAAPSGLMQRQQFFSAKFNEDKTAVVYQVDMRIPIPCLNVLIPIDGATRDAYPLGVFPSGVFSERLTIIANFNRMGRNVPTANTIHYEGMLSPAQLADATARPPIAEARSANSGNFQVMNQRIAVDPLYSPASNLASQAQPTLLNMCSVGYISPQYATYDATRASRVKANPQMVWGIGQTSAVLPEVDLTQPTEAEANVPAGGRARFNLWDQHATASVNLPLGYLSNTSADSWYSAQNLLGSSSIKQFGPACFIRPGNLIPASGTIVLPSTTYYEWSSGATSYLGVPAAQISMPGALIDYLSPQLIGIFDLSALDEVQTNVNLNTLLTGLFDVTHGLRNPSQIASSVRLEKCPPCPTFAPATYIMDNYCMANVFANAYPQYDQLVANYPSPHNITTPDPLSAWFTTSQDSSPSSALHPCAFIQNTTGLSGRAMYSMFTAPYSLNLATSGNNGYRTQGGIAPPPTDRVFNYSYLSSDASPIGAHVAFAMAGFTIGAGATIDASAANQTTAVFTAVLAAGGVLVELPRVGDINVGSYHYVAGAGGAVAPGETFAYGRISPNLNVSCIAQGFGTVVRAPLNTDHAVVFGAAYAATTNANILISSGLNPWIQSHGTFAGRNAFYSQCPPLAIVAQYLLRGRIDFSPQVLPDPSLAHPALFRIRDAIVASSAAPVMSSRFYFQHPNNLEANHWNYVANSLCSTAGNPAAPTFANVPAKTDAPAAAYSFTANATYPLQLNTFSQYIPSSQQEARHGIRAPSLLLDLVESFENPLNSLQNHPTGTMDNHRWIAQQPRPTLSGHPPISFLYQGTVARTTTSISESSGFAGASMLATSLYRTAATIPVLANPPVSLSAHNNPFCGSETRTNVRFALHPSLYCAASGRRVVYDATNGYGNLAATDMVYNPAISAPGQPQYTLPPFAWSAPSYFIGDVAGATPTGFFLAGNVANLTTAFTRNVAATFSAVEHYGTQALTADSATAVLGYIPTVSTMAVVNANALELGGIGAALAVPGNTNPHMYPSLVLMGPYVVGGDPQVTADTSGRYSTTLQPVFAVSDTGRHLARATQNIEQTYTHYPLWLVGVIGGGYGPIGLNQLSNLSTLDSIGRQSVHPPNPFIAQQAVLGAAVMTGAVLNAQVPLDSLVAPVISPFDATVCTGPFPTVPAPIHVHPLLNITTRYIIHCPAFPDLLTPGSSCQVQLTLPNSKFAVIDASGDREVSSTFAEARRLFKSSGIPTTDCHWETLTFSVPVTTVPSVVVPLAGDLVHAVGIVAYRGPAYGQLFQQQNITQATINYNGEQLQYLTTDLLEQPSFPQYIPGSSLSSYFSAQNDYSPSVRNGCGVWSFTKLGTQHPFSRILQQTAFSSVDTTIDWNHDRISSIPWKKLWIPLAHGGPLTCRANLQLNLTLSEWEANSSFPTILFQYVPHPIAHGAGTLLGLTALNNNVLQTAPAGFVPAYGSFPVAPIILGPTNSILDDMRDVWKASVSSPPYIFCPSGLGDILRTTPMLQAAAAAAPPFTAASDKPLHVLRFSGMVTDALITHPFFPPEWLAAGSGFFTQSLSYLTGGGGPARQYLRPEYMSSSQLGGSGATVITGLAALQVPPQTVQLPPTKYQPFGVKEFDMPTFAPFAASDTLTIEVTIVRTRRGLLKASDGGFYTRM
jgi:hypothetical protein